MRKLRPSHIKHFDLDQVSQLRQQGMSWKSIGTLLGVCGETLRLRLSGDRGRHKRETLAASHMHTMCACGRRLKPNRARVCFLCEPKDQRFDTLDAWIRVEDAPKVELRRNFIQALIQDLRKRSGEEEWSNECQTTASNVEPAAPAAVPMREHARADAHGPITPIPTAAPATALHVG